MIQIEDAYLYVLPGCPFCAKVDRFLDENGIEVEHRRVTEGTNRADLVALGGKPQSPCLVHGGQPLYESDDIIAWFKERL